MDQCIYEIRAEYWKGIIVYALLNCPYIDLLHCPISAQSCVRMRITLSGACYLTFPFLLIRTVYRATRGQSSRSVYGQAMKS